MPNNTFHLEKFDFSKSDESDMEQLGAQLQVENTWINYPTQSLQVLGEMFFECKSAKIPLSTSRNPSRSTSSLEKFCPLNRTLVPGIIQVLVLEAL